LSEHSNLIKILVFDSTLLTTGRIILSQYLLID